jgi:flagellin
MLQRSLNRLSSGSKIVNASDDAGGVAVAARLSAAAKRSGAVGSNLSNAISFLQNQDSALKTLGRVLERMSELQTLRKDTTKDSADNTNYQIEYDSLKAQVNDIRDAAFNGNSLMGAGCDLSISTDEAGGSYTLSDISTLVDNASSWEITDGSDFANVTGAAFDTLTASATVTINGTLVTLASGDTRAQVADKITNSNAGVNAKVTDLGSSTYGLELTSKEGGVDIVIGSSPTAALGLTGSATTSSTSAPDNVAAAIQDIAEARAHNGSDQSVLGYYAELNSATKTNYESAVSKIMDVDVAEESTQLARWNTLVQAGTAMVAQANGTTQNVLTLLRG